MATVDNADTAVGRTAAVLALSGVVRPEPNTVVGHYGTGQGAGALFPEPVQ